MVGAAIIYAVGVMTLAVAMAVIGATAGLRWRRERRARTRVGWGPATLAVGDTVFLAGKRWRIVQMTDDVMVAWRRK